MCFRTENYINNLKEITDKYDTITCFSISKWIHLNQGDFGIKALFLKVYESLEKGGIFIIESHTWKSYKKNKKMNEWSKNNYGEIKLRPNMFKEYLERIGFKFIMTIN